MTLLSWCFIVAGSVILVLASYGVLRLPGPLSRQHAATKAATLGLGAMVIGIAILRPSAEWWVRLFLLAGVLMATVPVASHALARAASRTQTEDRQ